MADEVKDVTPESSLEGAVASSPEVQEKATEEVVQQVQETEQAPPQKAETPTEELQAEEQTVPYARLKEVIDERNYLRELAQRQPQIQQPQVQPQDPYANMDDATARFYQGLDTRIKTEAQKIVDKTIAPQINAGVQRMAQLEITNFRMRHPEVKLGSEIEGRITQRVNQGYPLEEAYKIETYDGKVGQQSAQNAQVSQQRLVDKQKANVVSPQSLSPQTIQPPKQTFEEELRHKLDTNWDGT